MCAKCGQVFTTEYGFKDHSRDPSECLPTDEAVDVYVNHKWKPFECPTCFEVLPTQDELSNHEVRHRSNPFLCEQCEQVFNSQESLDEHVAASGEHNVYKKTCTTCQVALTNKRQHYLHEFYHGNTDHYLASCPKCEEYFTKEQFRIHAKYIHPIDVNNYTIPNTNFD